MFFKKRKAQITKLERKVVESEQRVQAAVKALAPKYNGKELEEYYEAKEANLNIQRELSLAKGEETALQCEWTALWDTGAPMPHVISSGYKTYLIYYVNEPDPNWDGTYVNVINPSSEETVLMALVQFTSCYSYRFGGANEDVLHGHALWGKGLEHYKAHIVANSLWIKEEMRVNRVHEYFNEDRWMKKKHYLLTFHDELFECIAEGFNIEVYRDTFSNIINLAQKRMMED